MMRMKYLAAVGTNNIVYGLGQTTEEARLDAKNRTHYCTDRFKVLSITKEVYYFIIDFGFNEDFVELNNDGDILNSHYLETKEAVNNLVKEILILKQCS